MSKRCLNYFGATAACTALYTWHVYECDIKYEIRSKLYKTISPIHIKWRMYKTNKYIDDLLNSKRYAVSEKEKENDRKHLKGCVLSGKDFNRMYDNPVKYINGDYQHHDMRYDHAGEYSITNTNDVFFPFKESSPGGLYFTTEKKHWYNKHYYTYMAKVSIPDDARVYIEPCDTFKTDKFILGDIVKIQN